MHLLGLEALYDLMSAPQCIVKSLYVWIELSHRTLTLMARRSRTLLRPSWASTMHFRRCMIIGFRSQMSRRLRRWYRSHSR